jgi:hypothetical protein
MHQDSNHKSYVVPFQKTVTVKGDPCDIEDVIYLAVKK